MSLTDSVTLLQGTNDLSCNVYNPIISERIVAIGLSAEFLRDDPATGWIRPPNFIDMNITGSTYARQVAGGKYEHKFPSKCAACLIVDATSPCVLNPNYGVNQELLAKKSYMFSNSVGRNVISGPITKSGTTSFASGVSVGGGSGSGLTKSQMYANTARGLTPSGQLVKRYGVQNTSGANPNIYSNYAPIVGNTIQVCNFKLF